MVGLDKMVLGATAATWDTEDCVGIFREKNVVDQVELPLSYLIIKKGTYSCIQGDCVWRGDGSKGGLPWEPSVKPDLCCCAITNLPSIFGSNQVLGSNDASPRIRRLWAQFCLKKVSVRKVSSFEYPVD